MTFDNLRALDDLARDTMPRPAFDYYAGGAADERSLRANLDSFGRYTLRPRVLVDVSRRDLSVTLLGARVDLPVGIAPAAYHHLAHPDGERATARAAARAGALLTASTMSSCSLEEIAEAGGPRWFQLYVHKEREVTRSLAQRAEAAGYAALVLTVDLPIFGRRERDPRNGFVLPKDKLGNFRAPTPEARDALLSGLHDASLSWRELAWLRAQTRLPLVLKGVLTAEDARLAVEHGAAAVWVSNHGGRQLDQTPAPLEVLPEVVAAVEGRAEVYLDGGVRRGTDVAIALALGARAVFTARPFLYALAVGGEAGVSRALSLLREETSVALALLGVTSPAQLGPQHVSR